MSTDCGNFAIIENDDAVGALHEVRLPGSEDNSVFLREALHKVGHLSRGFRIERAGDIVEEKNFSVRENSASDRDELALATGNISAVFADDCIITVRKHIDKIVNTDDFTDVDLVLMVRVDKIEIFADTGIENERILRRDGDVRSVGLARETLYIYSVEKNFSASGLFETEDEIEELSLPCAGIADEGDDFVWADF